MLAVATATSKLARINEAIARTHIEAVQQDSTGEIWGLQSSKGGTLFKWNGSKWNPYPFKPAGKLYPLEIQRVSDGSILCLWGAGSVYDSKGPSLLTEHQGNTSSVLATWQDRMFPPYRLFRTQRATWLTTTGTKIYRVENGELRSVYTVEPEQLHVAVPEEPLIPTVEKNSLEALEDGKGHIWFWSNELTRGYNYLSLRGLLEYDGDNWIHHPNFPGVEDKPYTSVVAPRDGTFWLGVGDAGLFELNTQTLTGKRFTDPEKYAFEDVQTIQQVGGVWYLVADSPLYHAPNDDYSQRQSDLWRWQDSPSTPASPTRGHFERILRGLDYGGSFSQRANRPLLATKSGLWIGSMNGGVWWMPFGQPRPAVHIDWRRQFFYSPSTLLLQRDGRLLASQIGITTPDLRPYLNIPATQTPQTFHVYGGVTEDRNHHLWRIPNLSQRVVEEWDGSRWRSYPIPATYPIEDLFYISPDTRGRIWLFPDSDTKAVALLDPTKGTWQLFPDFLQATQSQLKLFGYEGASRLKIGDGKYLTPRFSSTKRIAFLSPDEKLFLFDGQKWHNWKFVAITNATLWENYHWDQAPYFNPAGVLCIDISNDTWEWTSAEKWTKHETTRHQFSPPLTPIPPPGHDEDSIHSIVRDSSGAIWMTKDQQLWRAAWGLCEPIFTPDTPHPFQSTNTLKAVLIAPDSIPLLAAGPNWFTEYTWVPSTPPDTKISVTQQDKNSFRVRLSAPPLGKEKHWFRWRLDEEEWSKPQTEQTILVDFVPPGNHRLQVAAINAQLCLDTSPATATLRVNLTEHQYWNDLLYLLKSPDFRQREKAVKVFSRRPMKSLPILWAARKTADPDFLWWIDACIEEIKSQPKPKPKRA
ncbi:hypothetical protein EON83_21310 [bacterium]|nr:MAG: hypothetical protein EON83_21310 [bacterium]